MQLVQGRCHLPPDLNRTFFGIKKPPYAANPAEKPTTAADSLRACVIASGSVSVHAWFERSQESYETLSRYQSQW